MCSDDLLQVFKAEARGPTSRRGGGRSPCGARSNSLSYKKNSDIILPQYAIESACSEATRGRDTYITTEVGQHQMWAAQFFRLRGAATAG